MGIFRRGREPRFQSFSPLRVTGEKNALTASGYKIRRKEADTMRRLIQPWQARSFAYYDIVPEIKYAAQFYSRALSVLRVFPAEYDEDGDDVESTNPKAVEALDRIQDPGGGRSGLLASYGRLMFLIGEALLFVSTDPETDIEQWEILSPDELRVTQAGYTRLKAPSVQAENFAIPDDDEYEPVDGTAVAYRLWKRHPRYSLLADSTMQGVLDVCEELVLLTQAVRARARSRLAGSGILIVNGKVSPLSLSSDAPDEDPDEDPFLVDLTEAMTQPIVDEGAASAVVPLVVRTDLEDVNQAMKHIQILDPTQVYPETGLRYECIKRLAIGLDMPPEILMGMQDSNHWSSWQVDEQVWKAHLQPVAQQFCDDLTSSYFRPMLKEMGVADYENYCVGYDATAIINHPDRTADAKDLFAANVIGKAALREASGFDEEDAPTQEEWNESVGVKVRDSSLAVYGIPQIRGQGGLEPAAGEIEQGDAGTTTDAGASSPEATKGPPPEPSGNGNQPTEVVGAAEMLSARILGASDLALVRTRELAGSRLRNFAKRDKDAEALLDGVRASAVPSVLGRDRAAELGAPPAAELVAGAEETLADALRLWGIEEPIASRLGDLLAQHAAKTLYDERPAPLPPAFVNYVSGVAA